MNKNKNNIQLLELTYLHAEIHVLFNLWLVCPSFRHFIYSRTEFVQFFLSA